MARSGKPEDIIGLYRRHAAAWTAARFMTTFSERAWLDRFLALVPPRSHILDLGCGSGYPIAQYLIENGYSVTGVDSAPEMVAMFATVFSTQTTHIADMRTLALGTRFDGILAWDSFFHLSQDDQRAQFAVFESHAAPGAALMFTSGPAKGEAVGELEGEPLYHASLDADEYRSLLADTGFSVIDHVKDDEACGGHTIWLAKRAD